MAQRIKKVQVIRIQAYGGKLSKMEEILAELPSEKMAIAAVKEWQRLGHEAQLDMRKKMYGCDPTPAAHYGTNIWKEINIDGGFGYDRYWHPDFWHSQEEILEQRIFIRIIRKDLGDNTLTI